MVGYIRPEREATMDKFALKAVETWNQRPRVAYDTIWVKPLTHTIGAEIGGIDLSGEVTEQQLAEIRRALLEHLVVVFRDQTLTQAQHKAFGENPDRAQGPIREPRLHLAHRPAQRL